MNLRESLHSAVSDPPPAGIDLDDLARKERRQRQVQRLAGLGAGVAVVAIAVVAAMMVSSQPSLPSLGPGPAPTDTIKVIPQESQRQPTAQELATAQRLSEGLSELDETFRVTDEAGFIFHPIGWGAAPNGFYEAFWVVAYTDLKFGITVREAPIPAETECEKNTATITCERIENPDGSVTYLVRELSGVKGGMAEHYRPNGTAVMVTAVRANGEAGVPVELLAEAAELAVWDL